MTESYGRIQCDSEYHHGCIYPDGGGAIEIIRTNTDGEIIAKEHICLACLAKETQRAMVNTMD